MGCFNTQPPEGGWQGLAAGVDLLQGFNTQPPEGGWVRKPIPPRPNMCFNTQPPEGGWLTALGWLPKRCMFQHAAARRRLAAHHDRNKYAKIVSTRSRPKAAGRRFPSRRRSLKRFNTQPPEGGWQLSCSVTRWICGFNTQPPEGGWIHPADTPYFQHCFNTQPPEGGWC